MGQHCWHYLASSGPSNLILNCFANSVCFALIRSLGIGQILWRRPLANSTTQVLVSANPSLYLEIEGWHLFAIIAFAMAPTMRTMMKTMMMMMMIMNKGLRAVMWADNTNLPLPRPVVATQLTWRWWECNLRKCWLLVAKHIGKGTTDPWYSVYDLDNFPDWNRFEIILA